MKAAFENLKQYAENIDEAVKDINEKTIKNLKNSAKWWNQKAVRTRAVV